MFNYIYYVIYIRCPVKIPTYQQT